MSFLRVAAIRSSPSAIFSRTATRTVRRTTSQPCLRIGQQTGRRGYASATGTVKKTSDLPWAATAVVVTAVGTYIALSPTDGGEHAHDSHHEGQGKKIREEAEHLEKKQDKSEDEPEAEAEAKEEPEETSEEKDSGDKEDKEEEKPTKENKSEDGEKPKEDDKSDAEESKGDDSGEKSEDAETKGDAQKGATKDKTDLKHREEDSGKGATKVRIDSPAGKTIGEGSSSGEGDAAAKAQKGVSNTDTKHSTDPHADAGKSSKGEGTVETAKIKGTVQPDRPQV